MKIVYWTLLERKNHSFMISFWTKPDKSNAITIKLVDMSEDKLRFHISGIVGYKRFILERVK